jgi:thiol-disulfide isomerase/thioredoxin
MKGRWVWILGAAIVAGALVQMGRDIVRASVDWSSMGPLPPGSEAPAFAVRRLDGGAFGPEQLQGRVSVVTFWATWCPACRSELGDLDELDDRYAGRAEVQFLAVNQEGAPPPEAWARARGYVAEAGVQLPVAVDNGSMARTFRVGPIPHTVVFDRSGTVRHVHQGRVSNGTIADEIEDLLRESP